MDIRSAICNLVKTVQNFITDPQLKIQLNELYNLASKPNSKIDDIERLMNNLGKSQTIHNRVVSQPNPLNSSKHSYKIQAQSGASVSAFSNGINQKIPSFGSRIQYTSPIKTYREDRQNKTNSDRQICLTSETLTQTPKNQTDVKPFDKLTIDLPPKFKTQSKVHNHCPTVPVISELLEQSQKKINIPEQNTEKMSIQKSPKQQSLIIKQYDQQKVSGRVLMVLESCIKEMSQNTFKLILTTEKTNEIDTCSSVLHNSSLENSITIGQRRQFNPLQKGLHQKMSDRDLFNIQQNFLMKKLIVKAKQIEKSSPVNPSLDIFLK
ncbi:unnamed protein product (macronuclear) [Paramecium tetraurelia]|uniref:Uncharacterized protein n=1 Tax=Paramecium tetraurelia TaxID=5888 RepID=A0C3P1_PARTE|nr:uncharacterized protein GSPATT00034887001 [Paramecium tetraurelia]CAK65408.1 unnamed protein product [Paramecium tetraurelia]|eukprot:XP_001432805.1 hypothetical protein (macronuclear) [Paramecium tetraurelia strain d4-2]